MHFVSKILFNHVCRRDFLEQTGQTETTKYKVALLAEKTKGIYDSSKYSGLPPDGARVILLKMDCNQVFRAKLQILFPPPGSLWGQSCSALGQCVPPIPIHQKSTIHPRKYLFHRDDKLLVGEDIILYANCSASNGSLQPFLLHVEKAQPRRKRAQGDY